MVLFESTGDLPRAREMYERALTIRENRLGPEHPETAESLDSVAHLLSKIGHVHEAELLFQRAMGIANKALGPRNLLKQRIRTNYARLLIDTHRPADALVLAERALARREELSGADSRWTKESVQIKADALDALGRRQEAMLLRARYRLGEG